MESMKRLLWWMLAGSSGGLNRGRILMLLKGRPYNAHQMARELGLDYKTVRHHLDVLMENSLLISRGDGYGKMYFLSPQLEADFSIFERIWEEIGKTQIKPRIDTKGEGTMEGKAEGAAEGPSGEKEKGNGGGAI